MGILKKDSKRFYRFFMNNKNKIVILLIILCIVGYLMAKYMLQEGEKGRASADTVSISFNPNSITSEAEQDHTSLIVAKPSSDITIQGYKMEIRFDITKVQIKSVDYKIGIVSTDIGQDNSKLEIINKAGLIRIQGEIQSPEGYLLLSDRETEIISLNFTSKSKDPTSITIDSSVSWFYKVNADNTISEIVTSPSVAKLKINSQGITPNLLLKFQGISRKPEESINKMNVKVVLVSDTGDIQENYIDFVSDDSGIWKGEVEFNTDGIEKYKVYIKGPKHLQKRICVSNPTEGNIGDYSCAQTDGGFTISQEETLDFSNINILSGDLPENGKQNGVIDSYDISFIRNNLGKTEESVLNICDINLDNICDTQDYSLLIQPLGTGNKYDEGYTDSGIARTNTSAPTATQQAEGRCLARPPAAAGALGCSTESYYVLNGETSSCQECSGLSAKATCSNCSSQECVCDVPASLPPITVNCTNGGQLYVESCN